MNDDLNNWIRLQQEDSIEIQKIADRILETNPYLGLTAHVMARDEMTLHATVRYFNQKKGFFQKNPIGLIKLINAVGTYSRVDFIEFLYDNGAINREWQVEHLPYYWCVSDPPDDTDKMRHLWHYVHNYYNKSGKYPQPTNLDFPNNILTYGGEKLPLRSYFTVYRGTVLPITTEDPPYYGISWTTDVEVAKRFARGAGIRQSRAPGHLYRASVRYSEILAYITARGEEELIVRSVNDFREIKEWQKI